MPETLPFKARTIVAVALLAAVVILGYSGVVTGEVVAMLLVSIAGGYGFMKRRSTDDSTGGKTR